MSVERNAMTMMKIVLSLLSVFAFILVIVLTVMVSGCHECPGKYNVSEKLLLYIVTIVTDKLTGLILYFSQ